MPKTIINSLHPLVSALLICTLSPARADYHYTSRSRSNTYPCISWEMAADSIQNAINAANPGDTVYIGAGRLRQH